MSRKRQRKVQLEDLLEDRLLKDAVCFLDISNYMEPVIQELYDDWLARQPRTRGITEKLSYRKIEKGIIQTGFFREEDKKKKVRR